MLRTVTYIRLLPAGLTHLYAVAVAVHVQLAAASDAPCLDHCLEVCHVLHMFIHVRRQHLRSAGPLSCTHVEMRAKA